jgi:vancomycin permeability regulator SanA
MYHRFFIVLKPAELQLVLGDRPPAYADLEQLPYLQVGIVLEVLFEMFLNSNVSLVLICMELAVLQQVLGDMPPTYADVEHLPYLQWGLAFC